MPGFNADQIRERLHHARLYLCLDSRGDSHELAEVADAALAGGVDIIQLRDKPDDRPEEARQEIRALDVLAEVCARHDALLSVNDRADIAFAVEADILHLGQDDLPVTTARRILGDRIALGRSTHTPEQARAAATETGVDYFCVGPCWPTPTKPGRQAPGLELVRTVASDSDVVRPWFAIGGIDLERVPEVRQAGAHRAVVVRAITEADDPRAAAAALRASLTDPR